MQKTNPTAKSNIEVSVVGLYFALSQHVAVEPDLDARISIPVAIQELWVRDHGRGDANALKSSLEFASATLFQVLEIVQGRQSLGKVNQSQLLGKASAEKSGDEGWRQRAGLLGKRGDLVDQGRLELGSDIAAHGGSGGTGWLGARSRVESIHGAKWDLIVAGVGEDVIEDESIAGGWRGIGGGL